MNGKKARLLRKEAKALAQVNNLPEVNYWEDKFQVKVNYNGVVKGEVHITKVLTECVRAYYKQLKKEFYQTNGRVNLYGLSAMINQ